MVILLRPTNMSIVVKKAENVNQLFSKGIQ